MFPNWVSGKFTASTTLPDPGGRKGPHEDKISMTHYVGKAIAGA